MTYYPVDKLNFFLQKAVPQAYDGAASYVDLLNKVMDKLNEVVHQSNDYFAVDLETYAEGVLQKWADDGTLEALINDTALADVNTKVDGLTTQLAQNMSLPSNFDFSAGTSDNSTKIQTALQNSSTFKFPKGDYSIINTTVLVTTPTVIIGDNKESVIKITSNQLADGTTLRFKDVDGLIIRDIKLSEVNLTLVRSNLYGTLSLENCKNVILENVEVDGSNGVGIHGIKCENVTLINCRVHNTKADGVHFQRGSKNIKFINCDIQNNEDDSIGFVSHASVEYGQCDGLEVYGGVLGSNISTGSGICADGSKNIKVRDVTIKNTQLAGIRIAMLTDSGEPTVYPQNIDIQGLKIDTTGLSNVGLKAGINVLNGSNVSIKDIILNNCKGDIYVVSSDGMIDINHIQSTDSLERGVWVSTQTNINSFAIVKINDIISRNIQTDGVYVDGTNLKMELAVVTNSDLKNINNGNTGSIYGVFVNNANRTIVKNNNLYSQNALNKVIISNVDDIIRQNNFPLDENEVIYIGTAKHTRGGSAPISGNYNLGDVVWNWDTGSVISYWECSGTNPLTWKTVKYS